MNNSEPGMPLGEDRLHNGFAWKSKRQPSLDPWRKDPVGGVRGAKNGEANRPPDTPSVSGRSEAGDLPASEAIQFTTMRSQVAVVGGCWLVVAVFAGESHLLSLLPAVWAPVLLVAFTVGLSAIYGISSALRNWLEALDIRWLVSLHLLRGVEAVFLWMDRPPELLNRMGAAAGAVEAALALAAAGWILFSPKGPIGRWALSVWNSAGLLWIGLALAVAVAQSANGAKWPGVFLGLPWSLIPTFLAPVLLSSHLLIHHRLRKERKRG